MRHPSGWPTCTALALVLAGLVVLKTAEQHPPLPPDSREPVLSADGSTVTFLTFEGLVSGDRNGTLDLYAKRLATGEVTLVSAGGNRRFDPFPFGVEQRTREGSGGWWAPSIRHAMYRAAVSGDGRYVAFTSTDPGLVSGDTNDVMDVFVRDLHTRTLVRASTTAAGSQVAGASGGTLALSRDGRTLAFLSLAGSLVPGDTNGRADAFVKDLVTGALTRASTAAGGPQLRQGADIGGLALSGDGSTLAFATRSPEVTGRPPGPEGPAQIAVKNLRTGGTTWASALPGEPARDAADPALSDDGGVVAFVALAPRAPGAKGPRSEAGHAYVRDLRTGTVVWTSGGRPVGEVAAGLALSGDGRRVALTQLGGGRPVVVVDLPTGAVRTASRDSAGLPAATYSGDLSLSADGDRVSWSGRGGRVKVLSDGQLVDVARSPDPSYLERLVDAAVPDPVSLDPLRQLVPWAG